MSGFDSDQRRRAKSLGEQYEVYGDQGSKNDLLGNQEARLPDASLFRPADLSNLTERQDKSFELQKKVSHLTRTMHHNLQTAMLRGTALAELQERAGSVELGCKAFSQSSSTVQENLWWKERRVQMLALTGLAIVFGIIAAWLLIKRLLPFF